MKKYIFFVLVALIGFVSGCATTNQPTMEIHAGISELELVRKLGSPHRGYSVGNSKFLTYEYQEQQVLHGMHSTMDAMPLASMSGIPPIMTSTPSRVVHRYCVTTFEIADGKVVDWKADGNACPIN